MTMMSVCPTDSDSPLSGLSRLSLETLVWGDAPSWNSMQTCMPHFLDKVAAFLGKEANALLTLNKTSSGFI